MNELSDMPNYFRCVGDEFLHFVLMNFATLVWCDPISYFYGQETCRCVSEGAEAADSFNDLPLEQIPYVF